ncbi:phenylalanyl-tRNA synthetase, beta subunit [Oleidesulfovibrio alaskensis G20]|jgi:phenylalanyl-tRNA synthetase beta chain|uniref:Phenylalanine--tRNA ligase beta subunit n=1 Tax=Oleidesulfovibrio alaskensis (strain ATCC BAA-1058 / DSM 17464 / G20) TaxID=207559 RepID=SYFB_OLEA2|nr:phenylalanine--tRNA ligase subunit beta [Oleidesulfovibrio alaskensis]Q30Y16.1 RecName: Full=Phenylalanine--tRNA ligase beta subunit; AltName: Full=Phenylalanyl-tRNA synthetase beta subunit; Short=PheRS [Oleidesulfovibrio alaskensis G20]ABB39430.1 phenylalanyl-tRNA synthetase, beta subunit [Oleidesulfovibrio alaskensis G20]MBG0772492.1 phenylalanine--tRNA ligase subunit beta [Oleidesulfovibrio alaskensis]MBL3582146.1 phenylalanine--tRNA ligase subunit beta [Oleidesulfovibrio alaskensis]
MLLSLNWLREFVPYTGTAQELGDRLTMLGLELEEIIRPFDAIADIVVGHVLECGRHPEADKLSVCRVDVGTEVLDIVCGAPNVAAGQKVPVAKVGVTMPSGLKIKKAKLRGQPSCGMICSESELELSDESDGIMVLPQDSVPGVRLVDLLQLDDTVLDISITPNRADCLSVLGLAREVALAFDLPLTMPQLELREQGEDAGSDVTIAIADGAQCPVYQGRIIEGISTCPSPLWMRHRLKSVGVRPISAIVDVTNYILMELGQPLHAFDLDLLEGARIVVETAAEGERFTTLDGQERVLKASDLLIRDGAKAVALAGVMGGANTEINDASRRVFLECAVFKPATIRRTARRLGLSSESSYRFERGVDQVLSTFAMNRAAQLMCELSGGVLRPGVCRAEPAPWQAAQLRFRPARAAALLGISLDDGFCRETLQKLGCTLSGADTPEWTVTAPSHRHDLEREADLIEEVGRVYGMDNIPPVLPKVSKPLEQGRTDSEYEFWARIKAWGRGLGLNEAVNYSFVGHKDLDFLGLPAGNRISIMNPLTSEQDVLRTELAPGLLNTLRHNLAQGSTGLQVFELAHIFEADQSSDTTARESGRLGLLVYGQRYQDGWPRREEDAGYEDLKGIVEHLLRVLNLGPAAFTLRKDHSWLLPCVEIRVGSVCAGVAGRVKPDIADAYHARKDVWMAEIDLDALRTLCRDVAVQFSALPVFPPVKRDITVMAPASVPVSAVTDHVRGMSLKLFSDIVLVDVFEPETPEGGTPERNLTFRLTFRHAERTLKDKEVDKERDKVAESLTEALGVRI